MVAQKEVNRLIHQLAKDEVALIDLDGSNIVIRILDQSSTFSLSTSIYFGGNFIPKSVRSCLTQKPSFAFTGLHTNLIVDEPHYHIYLNYIGSFDHITGEKFKELLEEFTWLAEEWRHYLDENDKNDLIHIRIKK